MSLNELIRGARKAWHGVKLYQPDWRQCSHSIAFTTELRREQLLVHLMLNAYRESLDFELPPTSGALWHRWIDTSLESPNDIVPWHVAPTIVGPAYPADAHSVVVLFVPTDQRV